jgi:WD40 repeat protein
VRLLTGPGTELLDLAFSPDGTAIAAGYKHDPVYLWNLTVPTPTPVRLSTEGGYATGGLQFSPDGRTLWWRRANGRRGYNRDTREYLNQSFAITGATHGAFAGADGARVVSQHFMPDYCLIGWHLNEAGWSRRWTVSIVDVALESIMLSPDGRLFAVIARSAISDNRVENPRQVEVWDWSTGKWLGKSEYPYSYAGPLHFSSDAKVLIGFNGMSLMSWDVPKLNACRVVQNDTRKHFTSIAIHPSGEYLYAASNDTTVHVFSAETLERVNRFEWKIGKLKSVAISTDGTLAAAGGDNGEIVIWDVDD